jgi:hypothetical protein
VTNCVFGKLPISLDCTDWPENMTSDDGLCDWYFAKKLSFVLCEYVGHISTQRNLFDPSQCYTVVIPQSLLVWTRPN